AVLPVGGAMLLVAVLAHRTAVAQEPTAARLGRGQPQEVRDAIERVRTATERFKDLDSAIAAGYARDVPRCLASPDGGMGFHHVKRELVDKTVELERPEILLFERLEDGRYVLNGVEYIIPYTRWPSDSTPPTLLGRELLPADNLRLWYLHMWVWRENKAGLFADWNPAVKCRTG
ncbi:MAG TPA: hypothetical protein VFH97_08350, partial [Gemmatimonadales bacterium]|nr:hypothetical protein [Gemmatimonadales bacterium]